MISSRLSILTIFLFIISFFFNSPSTSPLVNASPLVKRERLIVAWSEFKNDSPLTVTGFVTFTQLTTGEIVVTGQFNEGFNDPDTSKYTFTFSNGYDLTGKFNLNIQNGGTAPWTVTLNDFTLQPVSAPKLNILFSDFTITYGGIKIGQANIILLGAI
ncbi:hypothetical protein G9A89_002251 [Geosiphon pyriformis]|nr:hypothetical protein G9A89_002251 [Geosiphon pyriformis]